MTKTIRQSVILGGSPLRVYEVLIDSKRHAAFTGQPARVVRKVGGTVSCYGGYIKGFNLALVPGRLIVQAWWSQGWPRGFYSIVSFALAPKAGGRTKLTFTHVGVPASDVKAKSSGWHEHYWQPLNAYLTR